MQEKLATVAYFQEIDARRVIIREGHTAENFYFILSGTAIVTKLVKDEDAGKVELRFERYLTKGDSFGEMELLHHSSRQCTAVSQTPMTLLTVGRETFFKIFMSSQGENSLPDHIKFLSSLEMLKGFPPHLFVENREKCLLHFFRRGAIIVKDSLESEWLYFIKSGTCQVLKELKGLEPTKRNKPTVTRIPTDYSRCLPKLGTGAQASKTVSGLKCLAPPMAKTPRQRLQSLKSKSPTIPSSNFLEGDFLSKEDDHLPLLMMEKKLETDKEFRESYQAKMAGLDVPLENTTPHRTAARNSKMDVGYTKSKYNALTVIKNKKKQLAEATNGKTHVRRDPAPVYVQVDLLKPRDVFGLTNIKFDEFMENKSLNVSLVSRGAECVMVEKQFFIDNAPQEVRHAVMSLVRPYPEIEVLQGNLELKTGWEEYREDVFQMSQERIAERKALMHASFPV
ncbi:cyclic nucleotide-binding domain-containing protein 2-like isoform X2 [Watersipora subatra]|uniref:cyclic nucleotide-binding domain-containing protein 2-like isoform X2 n=1 Tax=Watersipora subatra TaxID=2589382 RepID=UPI00355C6057